MVSSSSYSKIIFSLGLFLLFCVAALYFALGVWMPFIWILLGIGICAVVVSSYLERKLLFEFFQMKTTKHGLNMGTTLFVTLCLICVINYFSVKFVRVFDYSMTGQYTLSDQTKKIIDHLDSDIEIKYFYKEGLQNTDQIKKSFLNLAKVFESYSKKVKISSVEMNSNPAMTEIFGATKGTGEAFVSYKGKINRIENQYAGQSGLIYSEQDITNALIKTTREHFKNIYFLSGHGERSFEEDKDEKSVASFKKSLEKNSYVVKNLNLISMGAIPLDADLIIVAGAKESFQKNETLLIEKYLQFGKPILFLLDQLKVSGPNDILSKLGWSVEDRFVFNILTTASGPMVGTEQPTVANVFSDENDITKYFGNQKSVLFFHPRPLVNIPNFNTEHAKTEIIVKTSEKSVALDKLNTTDYQGKPQSFNLGIYFKGQYGRSGKDTDIVFFTDVSLASNQFFNQTSNKDLLLNAVSFLAKETDLISIAPKEPSVSKIKMAGPEFNTYFKYIIVGLFFPMPIIFLILSLVIWFRQRHA